MTDDGEERAIVAESRLAPIGWSAIRYPPFRIFFGSMLTMSSGSLRLLRCARMVHPRSHRISCGGRVRLLCLRTLGTLADSPCGGGDRPLWVSADVDYLSRRHGRSLGCAGDRGLRGKPTVLAGGDPDTRTWIGPDDRLSGDEGDRRRPGSPARGLEHRHLGLPAHQRRPHDRRHPWWDPPFHLVPRARLHGRGGHGCGARRGHDLASTSRTRRRARPRAAFVAPLLEKFRHAIRLPTLGVLILLAIAPRSIGLSYIFLLPTAAEDPGIGAGGLGALLAVSGIGGLLAGLSLEFAQRRMGHGRGVFVGVAGSSAALIVFGVAPAVPIAMVAQAVLRGSSLTYAASTVTPIQALAPARLRETLRVCSRCSTVACCQSAAY